MQKQLITVDNLEDFICKSSGKVYLDGTRILTPGAKDELSKRGVSVEFGPGCNHPGTSCAAASCGAGCASGTAANSHTNEDMLIAVAATLQNEYGVTDPDKLKSLSLELVQTLKGNLSIF